LGFITKDRRSIMRRLIGAALLVLAASVAAVVAAGDLKSGLQTGDAAGAFDVKDVTGPRAGTSLCYR
jgi:hypothetical protein